MVKPRNYIWMICLAVTIGAHLNPEEEKELIKFLNKNKDVFA
jgi:hypothetical protein